MTKDKLATALKKTQQTNVTYRTYEIKVIELLPLAKNECVFDISFDSATDTLTVNTEETK